MRAISPALPLLLTLALPAIADTELDCAWAEEAPEIDGHGVDTAWSRAKAVVTRDAVADIDVALRCVYTDERIFLLASFPDATENRRHKTHVWDASESRYRIGPRREDTFILKWSMEPGEIDFSLSADAPYRADIWYWKAYRSDPQGHADDKHHLYTNEPLPRSKKLLSKSGRRFYLLRRGDEGHSTYKSKLHVFNEGPEIDGYELRAPSGSRADVRARGAWADGVWHVEFARALDTTHADDVQFVPGQRYRFGISRYEIAGGATDPALEIPSYAAGEVGEVLSLGFEPPVGSAR